MGPQPALLHPLVLLIERPQCSHVQAAVGAGDLQYPSQESIFQNAVGQTYQLVPNVSQVTRYC